MAQLIERWTLDFGSGYDPRVVGSDLVSGSTLSMEPAWDWFPLSLCHSPTLEIKIKKKNALL